MVTKAVIGFRFDWSERSSKDLQAMSKVAEQSRGETLDGPSFRRGGLWRTWWVLRDWKPYSDRSWPNKDNIDLTPIILQVGGPISWRKKKACLVSAWSSTDGNDLGKRSYLATPKTSGLATPNDATCSQLPSCRLMMSIPTNRRFLKPFSYLKRAFTKSRSPMAQSADIASDDLARPSSAPPILITPSSTLGAANIAMPVTSKIHFDLPPKWTLIAHRNWIGRWCLWGSGRWVLVSSFTCLHWSALTPNLYHSLLVTLI